MWSLFTLQMSHIYETHFSHLIKSHFAHFTQVALFAFCHFCHFVILCKSHTFHIYHGIGNSYRIHHFLHKLHVIYLQLTSRIIYEMYDLPRYFNLRPVCTLLWHKVSHFGFRKCHLHHEFYVRTLHTFVTHFVHLWHFYNMTFCTFDICTLYICDLIWD